MNFKTFDNGTILNDWKMFSSIISHFFFPFKNNKTISIIPKIKLIFQIIFSYCKVTF